MTADVVSQPATRSVWPWWLILSVVLGALLMATGGVIALLKPQMLLAPGDPISPAVRVYAGYLVSRNLALAAMLLLMLVRRSAPALSVLMALTAIIQLLDAAIDAREGRWALVPGVLVFAIVFLIGAAWLSRSVAAGSMIEGWQRKKRL